VAIETSAIARSDTKSKFRSGVPELDEFFSRFALPNHKKGLARTFVLHGINPQVLGFYSLSMCAASSSDIEVALKKSLPAYPIPVALLGRLAVHEDCRGQGLGQRLIGDAFERILDASEHVGCYAVIVDAKNMAAQSFYERYGFIKLSHHDAWPKRMAISLETIKQSFL